MAAVRIGADVGGTFTDVVIELADGSFGSTKVLTTYEGPEIGILDGISLVADEHGVDLGDVEQIIHGTTLATNALIERRGAKTALVTTDGFRDVIETRTEGRFEQYDLDIVLPTALIEREHRFVVTERMNARGDVLIAFDDVSASAAIDQIEAGEYEAVAIGFMHSYRNAAHERRFRDLLLARLPHLSVSMSAEVSPQMREFERFNTVCANAYVQPLMASYLVRLEQELKERGATCPLYLIHSGGGLVSVETAAAFPVRLVESGPAGGAIFAADLAARYGRDRVLSYDMGGTTAKIAIIEDYTPQTAKTFEVARTTRFKKGSGMPISIPVIEMIEIGAGGGSVVSVDALGQIRVGPHSAGSEPGPAAYDLGGTEPTITDANLQLGRLHPDTFGAKNISLSPEKATAAIESVVGVPLGMDADAAAIGIAEVVDENMTNAARVHAVENGKDLAGFSMVAFGGGAPLHATRLMDKLGLHELLVPPGAGVGSAIGFLKAPFAYEAVRSLYTRIDNFDYVAVNELLDELTTEAETFVRQGTDAELVVERQVSMRYAGQGWEIPVRLDAGSFDAFAAEALGGVFTKAYEEFFGRAIDDLAIETVSWSVRVSSTMDRPDVLDTESEGRRVEPTQWRDIYDPVAGVTVEAAVVERSSLSTGDTVIGSSVIVEAQTTTVLADHHQAVMQGDGTLLVTRRSDDEAVSESSQRDTASPAAHKNAASNEVHQQIMWNRLISILEEQALTLVRTAFSTSVREAGDLSAGVFDRHGRMVAQAVTGTPGHVNTMAAAVPHFIADIGIERIYPGDVYITNDPWKGTGHLHDITVTTPVFVADELIGFFASTAHVVDIGGRGYGPEGREIYEEGIRIPIMKWVERGNLNVDLVNILRMNIREEDQVLGDIHGLAASNETGRRRLLEMLDEFDLADLEGLAEFIFDRTRRATLSALAPVENGTYHNEMVVDGYDTPVTLAVDLTVTDDGMHADFVGTSPVSDYGINVPITYAQAYFTYGMLVALAPELPNNFASLFPFTVEAPTGVILNAQDPTPVSVRHVLGHFVTDLCLGAIAPVLSDVVPAEGAGALWNFQASARTADSANPLPPVEILMFNSGGTGARPTLDGLTATAFPSGVMTMSAEATEQIGPVVIWRKQIREDSGGRGKFRGGLGQVIEIGPTDGYQLEFSAMFDRVDHPARGRAGGEAGAPGKVYLDDGTPFPTKGVEIVAADRRIILELPGGGGFGNADDRDPAATDNDRRQGYTTGAATGPDAEDVS
ncbi:MAG: hydantoinase B/oxoprolinase family protein [Ilumatobacter sp.]